MKKKPFFLAAQQATKRVDRGLETVRACSFLTAEKRVGPLAIPSHDAAILSNWTE